MSVVDAKQRISIAGKLFAHGQRKWYLKGLIYGPFAPNSEGLALPERPRLLKDLAHIRHVGGNCIRVYFPPPISLLDDALENDLRVMIDVPWEKHRCFFEDHSSQRHALERVRQTARELGSHPGVLPSASPMRSPTMWCDSMGRGGWKPSSINCSIAP